MAGETVLVVDDRDDSLKFLREYVLEPKGYKVREARNGVEALEIVLSQPADLIITDLVMPRMGGLELLESLREKGLDTPAILMTFHGSEGTAVRAFRLGARDYIIKPFAVEEMLGAVDHALTESRLRKDRDKLTQTVLQVNQQLEGRVQELRFLYGIGRSVTSLKNLELVLNRIVEAAVYLTRAEEGSLMLVDQTTGQLHLRAARGMGEKNARNFRVKINDSIAGQVVRTGRPIMIGGMSQGDSYKVSTNYFVKALLNVPLKEMDTVVGVLAVNNKVATKPFSDRHLNLLLALADYATVAIQNARLYTQLTSDVNRAEQSSRELEKLVSARTVELGEAHQKLLKTEKLAALGYMAKGVANEIEAPIKAILQGLDQLDNRVETIEAREQLSSLKAETLNCREIVHGLLDFSGERTYQPLETNLNDVVKKAWLRLQSENNIDGTIQFVPGFDPNLPSGSVDSDQMEQALTYLMRYACRSMPGGGTLRVTTRAVGADLQIILSDTGHGLSSNDLRHIFDPFYQTGEHTPGLDLSITYAVIHRHQGTIEVESLPEQGTTFTIRLPRSHSI